MQQSDDRLSSLLANGSKATGHTHLERQNQQLSDELAKLRDEASRLEKKLKEKDHIVCLCVWQPLEGVCLCVCVWVLVCVIVRVCLCLCGCGSHRGYTYVP